MKKVIPALLAIGLLSGCTSLLSVEPPTPYEAGYDVVQGYVIARPAIKEKHREIVAEVYTFVREADDLHALTDELIREMVDELFDKAKPAERAAILVVFIEGKNALLEQFDLNESSEVGVIISEFKRGMEAAVDFHDLDPAGA